MTLERKGTGKHSHKEGQQSYEENKKNEVLRPPHPHPTVEGAMRLGV